MGTVMIVDDNPADRFLFRTILSRAGYTVFEVSQGRDALPEARRVHPHVVVLDVNLPDMDGHAVCRMFRDDAELSAIPVLMLTVRHDDHDVLTGLQAGADDYVAKDSAAEIILARVRRLIEFRQMAGLAVLNQQLVQLGRLLAGIIHEIRGPLAVIRGGAELLRMSLATDPSNLTWVDSILRATQALQLRLEHLMATVRSGSPVFQEVELRPLVLESTELFLKGLAPNQRSIRVETQLVEPNQKVRIDPGRFLQVLLNLLSNAHEAILNTGQAGRVGIRTYRSEDQGRSWVNLELFDDGPGIPEPLIDRIFEPFFTTKCEGTGYGLYLAREILREQGARISVKNRPEGGACFTIGVPGVPASTMAADGGLSSLPVADAQIDPGRDAP